MKIVKAVTIPIDTFSGLMQSYSFKKNVARRGDVAGAGNNDIKVMAAVANLKAPRYRVSLSNDTIRIINNTLNPP
ncbi:hypothetical protein DBB_47400 [Desulfoluna spongiiphila]|nr:hypothetical protein DBB_47400 [Desulfoluna spongiiphila]